MGHSGARLTCARRRIGKGGGVNEWSAHAQKLACTDMTDRAKILLVFSSLRWNASPLGCLKCHSARAAHLLNPLIVTRHTLGDQRACGKVQSFNE